MPKIQYDIENQIEIKKSKFITYLHRTNNEEEAKEFLKLIKKEHPNANHHCTAMIIGNIVRSNDDGEPSQTAGHPMLDVLMHHEMQDILVIVVRYFGGIKLGTGGLVRAYSSSVQEALKKSVLVQEIEMNEYEIQFPYTLIGKIDHYFLSHTIEVLSKDYDEQVVYHYVTTQNCTQDLKELSNGSIEPIWIKTVIQEAKI